MLGGCAVIGGLAVDEAGRPARPTASTREVTPEMLQRARRRLGADEGRAADQRVAAGNPEGGSGEPDAGYPEERAAAGGLAGAAGASGRRSMSMPADGAAADPIDRTGVDKTGSGDLRSGCFDSLRCSSDGS